MQGLTWLVLLTTLVGTPDRRDLEPQLSRDTPERYVTDLKGVKRRGLLRVLTRNNSTGYYISRGEQRGFEYELAHKFAEAMGVRVTFMVPETRGELMSALLDGEGDLIAAGVTISRDRAEKVRFSKTYMRTQRVVLVRPGRRSPLRRLEDLSQVKIHLSFGSTTLQDARRIELLTGQPLQLVDVGDDVEMEHVIRRVLRGQYEATIADDVLVGLERVSGLRTGSSMNVGAPSGKAWAFHPGSLALVKAANRFFAQEKRLLRVLKGRYFRPSDTAKQARIDRYRTDRNGQISPYDPLFRRAAKKLEIDWRLLAAVAFVESRFEPNAVSRFGAKGLMQLLPSTAARVGGGDLMNPAHNIMAGAKYLRRLITLFSDKDIEPDQQILFALAAYNAGLGHIQDARGLAKKINKSPNIWFGHVEVALKLKTRSKWHGQTKYGYARAYETISYVQSVQSQYEIYTRYSQN